MKRSALSIALGNGSGNNSMKSIDFGCRNVSGILRVLISVISAALLSACGSGNAGTTNNTQSPPVLSITKTHTGNFTQGQQNATYTVAVGNTASAGPTSGTVTVTDALPSGLTLVSIAGTGWTCANAGATCRRSDVLNAGASYPPITVTVNVAASASSPQVNQVTVSGGGSTAANSSDSTVISGFGISAAPTSLGVIQGASTQTTVTITATNGFTGNVMFATSGLPSGVTDSYSPTSASGSATSTLTLTASTSATVTASPVTVTITGTSGGLMHSTTVTLSVALGATGPTSLLVSQNKMKMGGGSAVGQTSVASHDGRFVAFVAQGTDISPTLNPQNFTQVFLRDTCGLTPVANCVPSTIMVSTAGAPGGNTAGNGNSASSYGQHQIGISPDGRFVVFESMATNLTSDLVGTGAVYLSDTCLQPSSPGANCTPTTVLVTKNKFGVDTGYDPSVSAGGRFVGFIATGKLEGNPSAGFVYYILDTCGNDGQPVSGCVATLTPIPINGTGGGVCGITAFVCSATPAISADGRYVVFGAVGEITNTVGGDIYLYDTCLQPNSPVSGCTPQTVLISTPADPTTHADGNSDLAAVSADGQFVAFQSLASNLVSPAVGQSCSTTQGGTQVCENIFVRLTCIGAASPSGCTPKTYLVSADASGGSTAKGSSNASISGDGQFVAFSSSSSNLTNPGTTCPTATNPGATCSPQIFVRNVCLNNTAGQISGCVVATKVATLAPNGSPGDSVSGVPSIGLDGSALSLSSASGNFVPGANAPPAGANQLYLFPMPVFP